MEYVLMNTDHPVLLFDDEFSDIQIQDRQFLPYMLKDYIKSTSEARSMQEALSHITTLKDFLAARTLNLSRENAKVILNVAALPQSLRTDERIKITFACRGLNMEDNFWLRRSDEIVSFDDINLRKWHLSEASYDIAILGKHISVTQQSLVPDLSAGGMFPKYWHRNGDKIELWKADKTHGLNSDSEIEAAEILRKAGCNCIEYKRVEKDGYVFSVCDCFTSDRFSLVKAIDIMDWCQHTKQNFDKLVSQYSRDFANMVVADCLLGNTDRHNENWGFLVDNDTNTIVSMAPVYDLNQALVIDRLGNSRELSDLIYEPCNTTFIDALHQYYPKCTLTFETNILPEKVFARLQEVSYTKSTQS